jgi:hypothetical protein
MVMLRAPVFRDNSSRPGHLSISQQSRELDFQNWDDRAEVVSDWHFPTLDLSLVRARICRDQPPAQNWVTGSTVMVDGGCLAI